MRNLDSLRKWLTSQLKTGFWFPVLTRILDRTYKILPGTKFSVWLEHADGAPELCGLLTLVVGLLWLAVIQMGAHPALSSPLVQHLSSVVPMVRVTEILLFSLHWVFSANAPLRSVRRSLAAFFLNLVEIAVMFSILRLLGRCTEESPARVLWQSLSANFQLEAVAHPAGPSWCGFLAHFQTVLAGLVLTIAIASLVGGVLREEKKEGRRRRRCRCSRRAAGTSRSSEH